LILDEWPKKIVKFVKVFPHDYKRVLGSSKVPHVIQKTAVRTVKEVPIG
jgi:hypothetical protein